MKRRQLFEFTDQPWCPGWVRGLVTDYLASVLRLSRADAAMAPVLARLLRASGARRIVDLCSGAAGPLPEVRRRLAADGLAVPVLLTDRYPSPAGRARAAGTPGLDYAEAPVDATCVGDLPGARTLCNCLHHFPPEQAARVLGDAVARRAPVAVFEITRRSALGLLSTLLVPPLLLLITPLIRPLTWRRLVFTYLLPLALLCVAWDAAVSVLRSYTIEELQALAAAAGGGYTWEAGQVRSPLGLPITYLIGWPPDSADAGRGHVHGAQQV